MICPICGKEMVHGTLSGDGRSAVRWEEEETKRPFMDKLVGIGKVTAAKHTLTTFTIEADYCRFCKKMMFDTDIST